MNPPLPANGSTRIRPGRRLSLRQALELQQLVFDTAFGGTAKPAEIAQLARAWDVLEDRKRVLRGKPLPGSLKPQQKARKPPFQKIQFLSPDADTDENA